jgi:ethanolamine utilization protein EutQ (cupin superfamily)
VNDRTVANAAYNADHVTTWKSLHTEDRYKNGTLKELGFSFLVYDSDTVTSKMRLDYEEVIHVVDGDVTLTVYVDAETYTVSGQPGDVLTIGKGSIVTYTAPKGTRLFVAVAPRDVEGLMIVVE